MAYLLPNSLILHIPKIGTDWIRAACSSAVQGQIRELGDWHLGDSAKNVHAEARPDGIRRIELEFAITYGFRWREWNPRKR